ncbi:MAG TPA: crosslink repair DNA glycosylase YcaQ family protein [Candidatus Limiplasma sp.]|nr:crosslink repair DNA glycosylase YcaQ family protein [Candidatus Limiplasma sp.]HRX08891.1 crosslink repair DNA glycosylase YcaQ family protein [Candidatus Limiplasma sp.]
MKLTNQQARQYLLLKQGLIGEYTFVEKQGALDYVRQAGCIQFDPVDACGKNAELTLQSRVKNFKKKMLHDLLYKDRALFDYPDKNLSILPIENWPYFQRFRDVSIRGGEKFNGLAQLEAEAKDYIRKHGAVTSDGLPIDGSIHWHSHIHWSGSWEGETNAARAVLEHLYATGELVIHHKKGTRKYYDLADKHLPPALIGAPDPLPDEHEHRKWRVLRRIGAVGMLWNKNSDAYLGIWGMKGPERERVFAELLAENRILPLQVEGIKESLYIRAEDAPLIDRVQSGESFTPRCEFLAALDCMMWDRKLIRALFGFDYSWEIYVPAAKRRYGYYVLPVLYGDRFIGRIEAVADTKADTLRVKNFWYEDGVRQTKKLARAVDQRIKRFARFNECGLIEDNR